MASLFDELLKRAESGNTDAQIKVAEMYFKGIGIMPSYEESIKWLFKAADKNKYAAPQITKMYREGIGVKKDLKKAFDISLEYANKGNEILMFELAGYYLNGIGVEKDINEAINWYKKSYEAGYIESAYFLGYIYQTNEMVKDNNEAINWYKKSAELNNPRACYNLAYIYYDGTIALKNNEEALKYANKAFSLGLKEAKSLIDQINSDGGYHSYSIFI